MLIEHSLPITGFSEAVNTWLVSFSAAHTKLTPPLTEVLPGSPRGTIQKPIRRLYCWQLPEMTLAPPTNNRLFIGFTGIWRSLIYVVQSFFYIVLSVWRRRWVCLAPKEKDDVYADRSEYRRTEVCTSQVVIRWRSRYRRRRWSYFLLTFYYFLQESSWCDRFIKACYVQWFQITTFNKSQQKLSNFCHWVVWHSHIQQMIHVGLSPNRQTRNTNTNCYV